MRISLWNHGKDSPTTLPIREPNEVVVGSASASNASDEATLHLEPIPSKEALLVTVKPPKEPKSRVPHVPCDIVLVIDVSGSMYASAPVPGESPEESTGLSVLDLTKHAARTIIETTDEKDRVGIVTFGSRAQVVQSLIPMNKSNKALACKNVQAMQVRDATNLWHGILEGIKLFKGINTTGKVPAIMVLTDGLPNHMCPPMGYVPKIRSMGPLPASIHTFGFGYSLRSGLLKSIAEVGGGNYAFIPDAGMIGTVFVHAVANLQTTFATKAVLKLRYARCLEIEETTGLSVDKEEPEPVDENPHGDMELTLNLGNVQYSQTRDILLRVKGISRLKDYDPSRSTIAATLAYAKVDVIPRTRGLIDFAASGPTHPPVMGAVCRSIFDETSIPDQIISYHEARSAICNFLASIFPMGPDGEHRSDQKMLLAHREQLDRLIENLPGQMYNDAQNVSLREDLAGEDPKGQISLSLRRDDYFNRWGLHYLPSLLNAHTRQICNSFKDPGPLQYCADSPFFIRCRDALDNLFDNLPAPEPTPPPHHIRGRLRMGGPSKGPISMKRYRNVSGVCFASTTDVALASGRTVEIRRLRRGMKVRTPCGPRRVAMVLRTPVESEPLCRIGTVLVTPWHPISRDTKTWVFPASAASGVVLYTGSVYSVLLEQDRRTSAHAIRVGDLWGVTLGHGLTVGDDVRAHEFFGNYGVVTKSLLTLERGSKKGVVVGGGVERDERTGLVRGFKRRET